MPPEDERNRWIADARAHGFPVMVTGGLLFMGVLGLSLLATIVLLALLMVPLQVWAARQAFPMPDPGD